MKIDITSKRGIRAYLASEQRIDKELNKGKYGRLRRKGGTKSDSG